MCSKLIQALVCSIMLPLGVLSDPNHQYDDERDIIATGSGRLRTCPSIVSVTSHLIVQWLDLIATDIVNDKMLSSHCLDLEVATDIHAGRSDRTASADDNEEIRWVDSPITQFRTYGHLRL